jgi:hypothetical protein
MLKLEPLATVGMGIGIRALGNIPLGVRTNAVACPSGTGMAHALPELKLETVGWTEISITSVRGELTLVAIQEMPDDYIVYLDKSAFVFATNGMFRREASPDGDEYFRVRNTTGHQYVVDSCLFGNLICKAPGNCGIMYSVANY